MNYLYNLLITDSRSMAFYMCVAQNNEISAALLDFQNRSKKNVLARGDYVTNRGGKPLPEDI